MHLYTMTPDFMPKDIISEFISAIWTERYSSAGDVQLVTPASPDMLTKLAHGTLLGLKGTKEVMILDTQSIENEILTVTGQSLLKFLDERPAYFENPDGASDQHIVALTQDTKAGQLISEAVNRIAINPAAFTDSSNIYNLDWVREKIPGLQLGRVDDNGSVKRLTINLGTLYNAIQNLAEEEGVGLKLYLESVRASTGPVFLFATYRGKNRTSEQTTHSVVRLTPKMDSLTGVKEISSSASYKNVVYVVYKDTVTIHYAEPTLPIPEGFDRRVLVVQADDIYLEPARYEEYQNQVARDAFANNNYIRTVDGQAAPEGIYKFMEDYGLGDIIELEGLTGTLAKARITEYIRTQDKTGEREYPTLSVVDHLSTGTIPDTEPDDIEPPGEGDPEIIDDAPFPEEPPLPEEPPWPEPPPPDEDPEPPFPDPEPPPPPPPPPPPDGEDEPPIEQPPPGEPWPPGDEEDEYILPPPNNLPTYSDPGRWFLTLSWEGTVDSGEPPEDWGEPLEGYPAPTGHERDYTKHYGRIARIIVGNQDVSFWMPQGSKVPEEPPPEIPGQYVWNTVVQYEDPPGSSNRTWPYIKFETTWEAYPSAHPYWRIPEPHLLPPIRLYLYPAGDMEWIITDRYQYWYHLRDEKPPIPATWTADIGTGNVSLSWQYRRW